METAISYKMYRLKVEYSEIEYKCRMQAHYYGKRHLFLNVYFKNQNVI